MASTVSAARAVSTASAGARADDRMAQRSRLASISLVLVLLVVSAFAVWSSRGTSAAASAVDVAQTLSGHYTRAQLAIASQQSADRLYRVDPGFPAREDFTAASDEMVGALSSVAKLGGPVDRDRVQRVLAQHRQYLRATTLIFRAADSHDMATIAGLVISRDARFRVIEDLVANAASSHRQESQAQLIHLRQVEGMASRLTPVVFLVGLLLAALLSSFTRVHRRLLDTERSRALHDSMHDALTGLPNRVLLYNRLFKALRTAKRAGTTAGLLLIDLDRFKEVNDTFGHHYGDLLLAQIGTRLRTVLREVDTIARLGGDEFAVLAPDVADLEAVMALAADLRIALEAPFFVEGVALDVEASVGVVISGKHGMDPTLLLQRADIAMYIAKAQNLGVAAYDPDVDGHSPAKLALLGELRAALNLGELMLYYQPKVSITTQEVVGAEALVRWQHRERGVIYPDAFIPLAEQTGLIGPLTTYVLGAALTQARVWMDAGRPLMVSVNLSARNLLDEELPGEVAELLASHGVPPDLLELEVTESALMTEPKRAQRLLEALAALGVRLSIDDFGAGYTSLGQLKNLPVTELKIDKSFIINMGNDESDALIVNSIVELGHNLGLTIVAEGVENAEALSDLTALSCDVAQGYYLSRPVPAATFDTWWARHSPLVKDSQDEPAPLAPGDAGGR